MSTLYRTLRQMEKDGFLESTWEPGPTGPARRVYTITDAGHAWLDSRRRCSTPIARRSTGSSVCTAPARAQRPAPPTEGQRDKDGHRNDQKETSNDEDAGSQPGRGSVRASGARCTTPTRRPGAPPSSRRWSSPEFSESSGRLLETMLAAQKSVRDNMRAYLETMNVPTREDIARLGELVVGLEEKIDQSRRSARCLRRVIRTRSAEAGQLDRRQAP